MNYQKIYWNELYQSRGNKKPVYDLWLDKYEDILTAFPNIPIIDLGCGFGNDTLYLREKGYQVTSCDFSEQALNRLEFFIDKPDTKLFDMKEGLPFAGESVNIIIADLSLHYFSWQETKKIVNEIKRVLKKDGFLLSRVNSVKDSNYGAGQGIIIEENYYDMDGKLKRFFDKKQLDDLFSEWKIIHIDEYEMGRYETSKVLWEIAVRKVTQPFQAIGNSGNRIIGTPDGKIVH